MEQTHAGPKTVSEFVQRACGHLEQLQLWGDPEKQARQVQLLVAHPCAPCLAAGWKAQAAPPEGQNQPKRGSPSAVHAGNSRPAR